MHILVTGHTGFKGAWLVVLLNRAGYIVSGIALDPLPGGIFETANISELLANDFRQDIRDQHLFFEKVEQIQPDAIIHLAAQPLVRRSYLEPQETIEVNVNGTLNVLEAARNVDSIKALLVVTTDKVYQNINQIEGYSETDPLGAADPYSSSKAMADLVTQTWVKSFNMPPTAIARAGNVIGGGDVSPDRLLVDLLHNFSNNSETLIRFPNAVRPWQHVLDCLNGYIKLLNRLFETQENGTIWNFGPDQSAFISVSEMATTAGDIWGFQNPWRLDEKVQPHEAGLLMLDSSKARELLNWNDLLPYPESLKWTIEWQKRFHSGESAMSITIDQIQKYLSLEEV